MSIHPLFKPFYTTTDIVNSDGSCVQVQMLRDTGALQSVLRESVCDESHYRHTGETRLIKGISKEVLEIPLVELHLRTNSMDKDVLCGLVSELQMEWISFWTLILIFLLRTLFGGIGYYAGSSRFSKLDLHQHNTNQEKHDDDQHTDDQNHVQKQLDEKTDADHHDVVQANDKTASLDINDTPSDVT